jgi:hypothetical protein
MPRFSEAKAKLLITFSVSGCVEQEGWVPWGGFPRIVR